MPDEKNGRVDNSFSSAEFTKSLTGKITVTIDPSKVSVNPNGTVVPKSSDTTTSDAKK